MQSLAHRVAAVRHFNRAYTRQIGVLQEGIYRSPFSLTEVRVLYELAHREQPTAAELGKDLGLDPGYLSRILRRFGKLGLLSKKPSKADGRQALLSITRKGREVFAPLDVRSNEDVAKMLAGLPVLAQNRLVEAMHTIEQLLDAKPEKKAAYTLRPHRPGDMGWVIHRHGVLYSEEYGYDERFEALVAEICAKFIQQFDPKRERCWIAEKDDEIVGCVFLVKKSKTVAKLRMLLVEPKARGLGLGKRLVDECVRFARDAGYKQITLWTQSELISARRIYEAAGFRLTRKQDNRDWSRDDLVSETWDLKL